MTTEALPCPYFVVDELCSKPRGHRGRHKPSHQTRRPPAIKRGALGRLRWAIRQKRRPTSLAGLLRLWWADFILHPFFECGERCQDCGREYVLWHAPDDLWTDVHASGFGLLCPGCFSRQADAKGITVSFAAERWPWWGPEDGR